ncbi:MAG: glutamate synthase GltB3 subunit [Mahella sp.]|nr:glutamate synthase GltB3 subunit [Mahella sp.]
MKVIDANAIHYQQLNALIKQTAMSGEGDIRVLNVRGQRYIGDGMHDDATITIEGVPGNDMAAFMDGPTIIVKGNAQDAIGNTMNEGKVIIHGHAGDTVGYAMRGGTIFIRVYGRRYTYTIRPRITP